MSDFVEYIPKRHGQRPPYWTPDTLTGLDNKNYVRQPNWAWIAGTTYYVPYEAVHGRPRLAENTIITAQEMAEHYEPLLDLYGALKKIEALQADNARLEDAWEIQHGEKVKEREEARLWFEKAQTWKADNAKLREALHFYAAWGVTSPAHDDAVREDGGDSARKALQETGQ